MNPELKNLIDLVLKLADWVNTITNFYIAINLGVVGWVISAKDPWSRSQRGIVIAFYLVAVAYNLFTQYRAQYMLRVSLHELKEAVIKNEKFRAYTAAFDHMLKHSKPSSIYIVIGGHIALDISVALLIWFVHDLK